MSAIFVSHSSADKPIAEEACRRLAAQGHTSVFLDFDPNLGIPAGRHWEKELYTQLRACRAIVVICSEHWLTSKWCFAEITHARALGKAIFPLKVDGSAVDSLLGDVQVIDLTADTDGGYARLWTGLKAAGLDPSDTFDWDPRRPPYPGLLAFHEEDAAIFFGRDPEIRLTLETLNRVRDLGGSRFVLMLGASGSGKSSLLRAGVLPRLRREQARWIVGPAFRPMDHPFDSLAASLAQLLAIHGIARDWKHIRDALQASNGNSQLNDIVHDLRTATGQLEAMLVLPVDQVEELLGVASDVTAGFLSLLRDATQSPHGGVVVIGTLRSDFLAAFQLHPASREMTISEVLINAMPMNRVAEIIEGPARIAGIELEGSLVQAMVEDTGTDDALPLLAFALRQLCDRFGHDRRLTVAEYREQLGGLQGAIARIAESVLGEQRMSPQEERSLRDAFLAMAWVNEEGQFVRRPARWDELPRDAQPLLERFVRARLLVSHAQEGSRHLEVAHEALFRNWKRLSDWLEQDRAFLLWRRRMSEGTEYWIQGGKTRERLWSGAALREAHGWLNERAGRLAPDETAFISAGLAAQRRSRRNIVAAFTAITAGLVFLGALAVTNARSAQRSAEAAKMRAMASMARSLSDADPLAATLVLSELGSIDEPTGALVDAMEVARQQIPFAVLPKLGTLVAISPDGRRIAGSRSEGSVYLVEAAAPNRSRVVKVHDAEIGSIAFSPDGEWIVTASADGSARLFRFDTPERPRSFPHGAPVLQALFSQNGAFVVTTSEDGTAKLWRIESDQPVRVISHEAEVRVAAFSHDSSLLVTGSDDQTAQVVRTDGTGNAVIFTGHLDDVRGVAFSPDDQFVATTSRDYTARIWRADGAGQPVVLEGHTGDVRSVAFDAWGTSVVTASEDGTARVWRTEGGEPPVVLTVRGAPLWLAAYGARGSQILTMGEDSVVRIWSRDGVAQPIELKHESSVLAMALSEDGRRVVTTTLGDVGRVWHVASDAVPRNLPGPPSATPEMMSDVVTSADGSLIASLLMNHPVMIWDRDFIADPVHLNKTGVGTRAAVMTHDGQRLVTGHYSGPVRVVRVDGMGEVISLVERGADIIAVAITGDDKQVLSAAADGTIRMQPIEGGAGRVLSIGPIWTAAFSADGKALATGSADGKIRVWRSDRDDAPFELEGHGKSLRALEISADGTHVIAISEKSVFVWPTRAGSKPVTLTHQETVRSATLSPDVTRVVSVADETRLWDVSAKTSIVLPRRDAALSKGAATSASFSPNGRWIAVTFFDGSAQLWPWDGSGTPISLKYDAGSPAGWEGPVNAVFSTDGTRLFLVPRKGPARMWIVDWREIIRYSRARTLACFSADERVRYLAESPTDATARASRCTDQLGERRIAPSR